MSKLSPLQRLWRLTLLAVLALFLVQVHRAFFPGESFYRTEFERVTGEEFPVSGQFVFKDASFPDFFGDHVSCAMFTIAAADYAELSDHLRKHQTQPPATELGSGCMSQLIRAHGRPLTFALQMRSDGPLDEYRLWGLLDDGRTVVFHYASW